MCDKDFLMWAAIDRWFDKQTISNEKLHERFESLKFHSWTASSLIPLIIND